MDKWLKDILPDKDPYHNRGRDQMRKMGGPEFECLCKEQHTLVEIMHIDIFRIYIYFRNSMQYYVVLLACKNVVVGRSTFKIILTIDILKCKTYEIEKVDPFQQNVCMCL
jgi:hypothetical protein